VFISQVCSNFSEKTTCPRDIVNARCSSRLAHPSGVEPEKSANKHEGILLHGHKDGHKNSVVADLSLQKVIAAWSKLPVALKAAILAIVNSSEDTR
jgi:hypothetical protein